MIYIYICDYMCTHLSSVASSPLNRQYLLGRNSYPKHSLYGSLHSPLDSGPTNHPSSFPLQVTTSLV